MDADETLDFEGLALAGLRLAKALLLFFEGGELQGQQHAFSREIQRLRR